MRLTLETGRTHQIRVHMAWMGCPLAGDSLYGGALEKEIGRTALHAGKVRLVQPFTGEVLEFEVPLPRDMERLAARVGQRCAECMKEYCLLFFQRNNIQVPFVTRRFIFRRVTIE